MGGYHQTDNTLIRKFIKYRKISSKYNNDSNYMINLYPWEIKQESP